MALGLGMYLIVTVHVCVQRALRFELVAHTCNPSPWEMETESSEVQGQPGLLETLPLKQTKNPNQPENLILTIYKSSKVL